MASQPQRSSCANEYVQVIGRMLYDEPVVHRGVSLLQTRCLQHGIDVRWFKNTPPTPSFARHIHRYYVPFCKDAITMALAVGFVPYIIRSEGSLKVPEVLPLGTFTWSVMRPDQQYPAKKGGPVLEYVITTTYANSDDVHVLAYTTPHALFSCASPISSLIIHYQNLLHVRHITEKAESWNCHPNLVFEESEKAYINDVADKGGPLQALSELDTSNTMEMYRARQTLSGVTSKIARGEAGLPQDSAVLFAPRNNTVHPLPKAELPDNSIEKELNFCRLTALALGIPPLILLQGANSCGTSATTAGNSWAESQFAVERGIMDACAPLVVFLEELLGRVYRLIYNESIASTPAFKLHITPSIQLDQFQTAYDADFIQQPDASRMMQGIAGCPLSMDAAAAKSERRKAANVLPFKDKKDSPAS